jgi:Leucine-rich repeat (LRR) protein
MILMTDPILLKLNGDSTIEIDLSKHQLYSLMQNVKYIPLLQHLSTCPNLQMLDLSSNNIKSIVPPSTSIAALTALKIPSLLSLNLSDNPIKDIRQSVEFISQLMPNLNDL